MYNDKFIVSLKGQNILKYFDYYQWLDEDCSDLFYPKNKNMIEFMKYISGRGDWKRNYYFNGHKTDFITEEIPNSIKSKLIKQNLEDYVFLEFTFPDEETAFYFKLKFDC